MNLSYRVGDDEENVRENRARFLGEFSTSEAETAFADQCHSSRVTMVSDPGLHSECDGLITRTPGLGLAISIADCVPILLYDPESGTVAAIHAGWRGSHTGIVSECCRQMSGLEGVQSRNIYAYIGPAAGPCCYEVGDDIHSLFRQETRSYADSRKTLDLKTENRLQLLACGIDESRIEVDERCTICSPDLLHSYRRDGNRSGRMLAFIGLTKGI